MCGRYYIDINMMEIKKMIDKAENNIYDFYKTGEIFPSNIAPIYIQNEEAVIPILAKWGLPKWNGKGVVINARSESIEEKHMFKKLIKHRCTIPASAYFEWKEKSPGSKSKDKYIIKNQDSILYFAGLYSIVPKHEAEQLSLFEINEPDIYYTIITKEADSSVSHIHDRMPVILDKYEMHDWLNRKSLDNIVKSSRGLTSELIKPL